MVYLELQNDGGYFCGGLFDTLLAPEFAVVDKKVK